MSSLDLKALKAIELGSCEGCGYRLVELDLFYNRQYIGRGVIHVGVPADKYEATAGKCTAAIGKEHH